MGNDDDDDDYDDAADGDDDDDDAYATDAAAATTDDDGDYDDYDDDDDDDDGVNIAILAYIYWLGSVSDTCFDQDKVQRETEEKLETEAVNMIIERLLDNKPSLYWHYTREVRLFPLVQPSLRRPLRAYSCSTF